MGLACFLWCNHVAFYDVDLCLKLHHRNRLWTKKALVRSYWAELITAIKFKCKQTNCVVKMVLIQSWELMLYLYVLNSLLLNHIAVVHAFVDFSCEVAQQMLLQEDELKQKWKDAVRWLGDELERVILLFLALYISIVIKFQKGKVFNNKKRIVR